jgi:hypothetical protein
MPAPMRHYEGLIMNTKWLPILAVAVITATPAAAWAGNAKSMQTPGHKMQRLGSVPGHPGASGYAPGHQMQAKGSRRGPGASGYAPGRTTTGSSTMGR